MGRYSKGILGPFSGKVGTVVGSNWKGIQYMRSLPKSISKAASEAQLEQRLKFMLTVNFLKPVSYLVNLGFKNSAVNNSGFNLAVSYMLKNAITGTYPDYAIDYTKVLISRGELTGPWNVTLESATAGNITFSWTDNSDSGIAKSTDKAILMVYNPDKDQYHYVTDGAARSAGTQTLTVPAEFSGDTVEAWMAFIAEDGKTISTSVYAGQILVA